MNLAHTIPVVFVINFLAVNLGAQTVTEQVPIVRLHTSSGSKLTVRGGFAAGQWKAETAIVSGFIEADSRFPSLQESLRIAKVEVFVPVRSLQSFGQSWEPYNEQINAVIYKELRADEHPKIFFKLSELVARAAHSRDSPSIMLESRGELAIGGVTNSVAIPVKIMALPAGGLKICGGTKIRMSDFKLCERTLVGVNLFDTVCVDFEWCVAQPKKK